jgi:hypothetical protein
VLRQTRKVLTLKFAPVMAGEAAGAANRMTSLSSATRCTPVMTPDDGAPTRISTPSCSISSRAWVAAVSALLPLSRTNSSIGRPATLAAARAASRS